MNQQVKRLNKQQKQQMMSNRRNRWNSPERDGRSTGYMEVITVRITPEEARAADRFLKSIGFEA